MILGRTATEIAKGCSITECLLILEAHYRAQGVRDSFSLTAQALAAAAPWSKEAGKDLSKLSDALHGASKPTKPASRGTMKAAFGTLGVK